MAHTSDRKKTSATTFSFARARSARARQKLYAGIRALTCQAFERPWPTTPDENRRRRESLLEAQREFLAAAKSIELVLEMQPHSNTSGLRK